MVPLCSFLVAGRLIARFGAAVVIAMGSACFAAGVAWWAIAAGPQPDYAGAMLGGMLLTGIGVGLTLPTLMATAAASLPPPSFATGSAVVNMIRQIGLAVGVAVLVAVLGTAGQGAALLAAFQRAWWVTAAIAVLSVIPALLYLPRGPSAPARFRSRRRPARPRPAARHQPPGRCPQARVEDVAGPALLHRLRYPVVVAPMAGGPSTPELVIAAASAGAIGFLAAGYQTTAAMTAEIEAVRAGRAEPCSASTCSSPEPRRRPRAR